MPSANPSAVDLAHVPSAIAERLVRPGHARYHAERAVWNGRIDRHPHLIVKAESTDDIVWAVNTARAQGLPLAVRGAGHHAQGHGVCDAGIVVDLSAMKGLTVDAEARTCRAETGLTIDEFARGVQVHDLVMTLGSHGSVGLAGFTLGGGIGFLMGRYGLACDHLLAAEVVTADGAVHVASATENPDLFWALRGGGGNFGVVASLTFQLNPAESVLAGGIVHPAPRARDVLRFYRDFTPGCPDELTVAAVISHGPTGQPGCVLMPVYTGPLDEGARLLEPLLAYGPPVAAHVHPMPYTGVLGLLDGRDPAGAHYTFTSMGLPALSDAVVDIIAEFGLTRTSPGTAIVLSHQHGSVSRVPNEATAYAARHVPYLVGVYAGWDGGDAAPHEDWVRRFCAALAPYAVSECCVNLAGGDGEEFVRGVYGSNYARLTEVKRAWDPDNLFHHNHNIPPAA